MNTAVEPAVIALAMALSCSVYLRRSHAAGLDLAIALEASIAAVLGAVVGARLGAGLVTGASLHDALVLGTAGAVSWGALVGGTLTAVGRLAWHRHTMARHVDAAAPAALLGLAVARLGCFIEGHHFGRACDGPWCVRFGPGTQALQAHRDLGWVLPQASASLPVHPLQLYLVAAALAALLLCLLAERRLRWRAGSTGLAAIALFGVGTACLESFRHADTPGAWSVLARFSAVAGCIAAPCLAAWNRRHRDGTTPGIRFPSIDGPLRPQE